MTIRGGTGAVLVCLFASSATSAPYASSAKLLPAVQLFVGAELGLSASILFTICEANKLRSSFENTLSNSPVLFFPGYNDIITSYRIGMSSEANRNISSCERKVKVQLPSLKSLGFFSLCLFPWCSHLTLATRWAPELTGMMEIIHAAC